VEKQLWKNAYINWSTYKTHDYKWTNFGIGTGVGNNFQFENKLSWKTGIDLSWNKYMLYNTGNYYNVTKESRMTMWSLSVPLILDYQAYKNFWTGVNVFSGPVYEQILTIGSDQIDPSTISRAQFGWTVGTRLRFFAFLSLRVSYNHYFTGLFTNGDFNRSAVRFSIGF
jgi:hypothetical protein